MRIRVTYIKLIQKHLQQLLIEKKTYAVLHLFSSIKELNDENFYKKIKIQKEIYEKYFVKNRIEVSNSKEQKDTLVRIHSVLFDLIERIGVKYL